MTAIYISKEQEFQKRQQEEGLAADYEAKREKKYPGKIHKYNGIAFVNKNLVIKFINGNPCNATHNGLLLGDGSCSLTKLREDDVCYLIGKCHKFLALLKDYPNMSMTLQKISDGCIYTDEAKVYDEKCRFLADLTLYEKFPIDD